MIHYDFNFYLQDMSVNYKNKKNEKKKYINPVTNN